VEDAPLPLDLTARTLFAELRERLLSEAAQAHAGQAGVAAGTLVRKEVRGHTYLYHQHRDLDGRTRQAYLGPAGPLLDQALGQRAELVETAHDAAPGLEALAGAFLAAGGHGLPASAFRIVQAFAQAGVLRPFGGLALLVGTYAWQSLGNLLGVRWRGHLQTHDIDVAAIAHRQSKAAPDLAELGADIDLAIPDPTITAPAVLEQLAMGFTPVPTLDPRQPSTSYVIRGKELRVDLLTPLWGRPPRGREKPLFVPALGTVAQPLRHLDFLLVDPVAVPVLGKSQVVLVQVPAPGRFALHKLLLSELRPAVFATKAVKDRHQALQLLQALVDESPTELATATAAFAARSPGEQRHLKRALAKCGPLPTAIGEVLSRWR
jgi:hypothetical protein